MKTRNVLLIFAAVLLLLTASAALADPFPCNRCVNVPTPHCVQAFHAFGHLECTVDADGCHLSDDECGGPGLSESALASEYVVASVERIDEPQAANGQPATPAVTGPLTR